MTPDDGFIQMARFDAAHAKRVWDGSAAADDAPAWYGRVATLIRAAAAPAIDDELAGESDVVARMQAAILEPPIEDELAGESDIVARMRATILGLGAGADDAADGDADDPDRPRHLRPAIPWAARHRQGVRVVRRIVAVKAAAITTVVAIGVTAAAATTGFVATVVVPALSKNEPRHAEERETTAASDGGSWSEGSGDAGRGDGGGTGDDAVVTMDPNEPLKCMLDLDCLLYQVDVAAGIAPAPLATPAAGGVAPVGAVVDPSAVPAEPAPSEATTTTTTEPPTTTTTEPPTTTTTTEPPTTTTTEPPPPPDPPAPLAEVAGPPPEAAPLSAPPGGSGSSADARAADLSANSGVGGGGGTGSAPVG